MDRKGPGPHVTLSAEQLPRRLWWLLAGLTLAWGMNWTAVKVALTEIAPWTFRSICLGGGAVVLFVALRASRQPLAIPRSEWARLALVAFFVVTLWNLLIAFGVRLIPSGRAAILAYTMPALAIPLSVWFLGERMSARKSLGLALGMGGMALLLAEELAAAQGQPLGALFMLGAALSWAVGSILQKKYPISAPLPALTAWLMLVGGVPVYLGMLLFEYDVPFAPGLAAWLALGYSVFIAFAWGYWAWIKIVEAVSVSVFSLCILMAPVVGVFSGILFLGERPGWTDFAALALVIGSITSVLRR